MKNKWVRWLAVNLGLALSLSVVVVVLSGFEPAEEGLCVEQLIGCNPNCPDVLIVQFPCCATYVMPPRTHGCCQYVCRKYRCDGQCGGYEIVVKLAQYWDPFYDCSPTGSCILAIDL